MTMVKSEWRELHRETGRKCPKLFYKFVTGEEGYQLYFTDLFALWRADASVEDIQDYAKITRTSIDPSDSTQLNVLLRKLSKSLAEGTNTLRQTEDAGTEAVLLSTTIKLPRPLQPLRWDFFLEAKDAADLGETILRPCLHAAAESRKKVDSLLEFINAKDRVIAKLLEKIEGTSLDLSLVFPGITGVRAKKGYVTLKEAQAHVPGLREFDLEQWRRGFGAEGPYAGFENDGLYNLVAGNETCSKHTSVQHQKWYAKLPRATATVSQAARIDAMRSSSPILNNSDTEDEFETQKRRKPTTKRGNLAGTDTDTDSEPKDNEVKHGKPTQKIRKVPSGSSNIPSSPPPISRTEAAKSKKAMEDSDATESESDVDLTVLPKTKPRLAGLGSTKKPSMRTELSRVETSSNYRSSSPLPVQSLVPSPPSSPPIQPPVLRSQQLPRPSQSRTESASSGVLKTGRLGGLRKENAAVETPEIEDEALSGRGEKELSTQTTPSRRRLGGLGRASTASQVGSPSRNGSNVVDKMEVDDHAAQDSEASTASVPSSPAKPDKANTADVKNEHDAGIVQINESVPQLSKEEKQSQRREELKRKHLSSQNAPVSNSAPSGGLRKKRKF